MASANLRAGSVDRRVVGLGVGRGDGCLGLLGAAHLGSSNDTVCAQDGESDVLVEDLAACSDTTAAVVVESEMHVDLISTCPEST